MSDPRLRYLPVQLRASKDESVPSGVLIGYASVYDVAYRVGYGIEETIAPGAFADSIVERDGVFPLFYQHDWNEPIGYALASEDKVGLKVEAHLFMDDNERARSVWRAADAGALREWSIGFIPTEILQRTDEDSGTDVEEIVRGSLIEASVVVRGANPETVMVDVRSQSEDDAPGPDEAAIEVEMAEYADREWVRDWIRSNYDDSI